MIFAFAIPFLYIVGLTIFFIYIAHKKNSFAIALPFALISTTLFVFLFTCVFHNISIGFWITVAASVLSIPLLICDKNRINFIKDKLITPGFIVFCIIYIFIFLLNWNKVVPLLSDTTMHWAPHVLTMWLNNDFYTSPTLNIVIHGDYPPAVQLFELIYSKAAGMYREGLLYTAIQVLSFSMMLPMLDKLVWNKKRFNKDAFVIIFSSAIFIIIPLIFSVSDFYSSLDVDTVMACIFTYCIYVAITESRFFSKTGLLKLSIASTFLCLTKQIAILFAFISIIIYLSNLFINYRDQLNTINKLKHLFIEIKTYFKHWKEHWKTILTVLIIISLPVVCNKLWSIQIVNYQSPDPGVAIFHVSIDDTLKIPGILSGKAGSPAQKEFARGFIKHIIYDPSGLVLNNISSISYAQCFILFIGFILIDGLLHKEKKQRKKYYVLAIWLAVGWMLYCLALYCVFLFGGMKDCEMTNLDTSDRYIKTYLFAMFLLVIFILFNKITNKYIYRKQQKSSATICLVTFAVIFFGIFFKPYMFRNLGLGTISLDKSELILYNMDKTSNLLIRINKLSNSTTKAPKRVLITSNTDYIRHYVQYKALPNNAALLLDTDIKTEKVCLTLRKYDYLLINYFYSNSDWKNINSCLDNKINFMKNTVYRISTKDDGKIYLTKL